MVTPAVSSLVVRDGVVYAGAVDLPANQSYIYALDARIGALLWRYPTAGLGPTVVAVVDGMVYASAGDPGPDGYSVFALRARDGQLQWSAQTSRNWPADVAVSGGVIYATGARNASSALFALQASDGKLLWQRTGTAADSGPFSLPTVVGSVVYVYTGPVPWGGGIRYASIYALRASDGAVLWRQPWQRHLATPLAAPVVVNGVIYTGTDTGTDTAAAAYALRASDGAVLWRGQLDESALDAPVVLNGLVYIPTRGTLDALNASDGTLRWRLVETQVPGPPLVGTPTDTMLYVSDTAGTGALDAGTGVVHWRHSYSWLGAERAVANGTLYVYGTSAALQAFNAVTGNLIWRRKPEAVSTVLRVDSGGVYVGAVVYLTGCTQPPGPSGVGYVYGLDAATGAVLWRYQTGGQLGS